MGTPDAVAVIKIIGLMDGTATAFDGQYVVEYNPGRDGQEPGSGRFMWCHLVTTPDVDKAKRYSLTDAFELWNAIDPRNPERPDGNPNKPLTAFTVEIMRPPPKEPT